ncbi:MAG: phosphoglycerate dehydrogenase [Bacillota bacterium]|nr:phosphoglycerate dehydrogenase [Bacillota bacterium]
MKILITPRSYGKEDKEVFSILKNSGIDIILNETGGILDTDTIKRMIAPCDGVILGVDPMSADVIAAAPNLKAISRYGVGTDNIDMNEAARRGIKVSRTAGANSDAVADYAMALMLAVGRRTVLIDEKCRHGSWQKITTQDLSQKTLGIFGLGAIGRKVAQRARGFDMEILAYDVFWDNNYAREHYIKRAEPDEIFEQADYITLHLPLIPETRGFIGRSEIEKMKTNAVLINTARGGLIQEDVLLEALKNGRIYGAGIDVFEEEPPKNPEWLTLPNVVLGSHCAASTPGATIMMGKMATENLLKDLGLK